VARVNIEPSIFQDHRFVQLCIKTQDMDRALGMLVRSWVVAQKWYITPEKMIPLDEWKKQDLSDLVIEVGLAEKVGDFVRLLGADEQFAWLTQRVESGRKGGLAKANRNLAVAKRSLAVAKPLTLSPSLIIKNKEEGKESQPCRVAPHPQKLFDIWNQKRGKLPEAKALSKSRVKRAEARWMERPDEEYWTKVVDKIAQSQFCNGVNDRGWRADFDFFLQPDTHIKSLEGKYDAQPIHGQSSTVPQQKSAQWYEDENEFRKSIGMEPLRRN
jgi:hypothetical protein